MPHTMEIDMKDENIERWRFAGRKLELRWEEEGGRWVLSIDGEVCAVRKGGTKPNRLWCHAMAFRLY